MDLSCLTPLGDGVIHNAYTCHIASQEIRTLPELSRTMELNIGTPHLYLPDEIPMFASQGIPRIEAAMPPEATGFDYIKERPVTPRQSFDVDTLLHVHQKSLHA